MCVRVAADFFINIHETDTKNAKSHKMLYRVYIETTTHGTVASGGLTT